MICSETQSPPKTRRASSTVPRGQGGSPEKWEHPAHQRQFLERVRPLHASQGLLELPPQGDHAEGPRPRNAFQGLVEVAAEAEASQGRGPACQLDGLVEGLPEDQLRGVMVRAV